MSSSTYAYVERRMFRESRWWRGRKLVFTGMLCETTSFARPTQWQSNREVQWVCSPCDLHRNSIRRSRSLMAFVQNSIYMAYLYTIRNWFYSCLGKMETPYVLKCLAWFGPCMEVFWWWLRFPALRLASGFHVAILPNLLALKDIIYLWQWGHLKFGLMVQHTLYISEAVCTRGDSGLFIFCNFCTRLAAGLCTKLTQMYCQESFLACDRDVVGPCCGHFPSWRGCCPQVVALTCRQMSEFLTELGCNLA